MPESVRDRPTRSHEYVFLLSVSRRYCYDRVAVQEPCAGGPSDVRKMLEGLPRLGGKHKNLHDPLVRASAATNIGRRRSVGDPSGRNRRSVWTIASQPYHGSHFATLPAQLVEPCVLAGAGAHGCCPGYGTPWARAPKILGWRPTCSCGIADPVPAVVLHHFAGSGTTLALAAPLGRNAIGVELNPAYLELIRGRCAHVATNPTTEEAV